MKKILLTLAIAITTYCSYSQTNTFPSSGYVGVGTTSPTNHLQVGSVGSTGYGGNAIAVGDGTNVVALHYGTNAYLVANGNLALGGNTNLSNQLFLSSGGNVGIGTNTPVSKATIAGGDLEVENGQGRFKGWYNYNTGTGRAMEIGISGGIGYLYNYDRTTLTEGDLTIGGAVKGGLTVKGNTGDVGIGTTTPLSGGSNASWLTVNGTSTYGGGLISSVAGVVKGYTGYYSSNTNSIAIQAVSGVDVTLEPAGAVALTAKANGNVLIGKTTQANSTYKLDINGSARANEVVVNTTGADFVFNHDYKLPKLSEVKSYIDINHHLPEIPSAEHMKKNGMSVGELNTKLLQKIEELTLYVIKQNERIESLEKHINTSSQKQ